MKPDCRLPTADSSRPADCRLPSAVCRLAALAALALMACGCGTFPTERQFERIADTAQGALSLANPFMFVIAAGSIAERIICPTWRPRTPAQEAEAKAAAEKEIKERPPIEPTSGSIPRRPLTTEELRQIDDEISQFLKRDRGAGLLPMPSPNLCPAAIPPIPAARPPCRWFGRTVMIEVAGQWKPMETKP